MAFSDPKAAASMGAIVASTGGSEVTPSLTDLSLPPKSWIYSGDWGAIGPEIDIDIWNVGSNQSLTNLALYAAVPKRYSGLVSDILEAIPDPLNGHLTFSGHQFQNGDGPFTVGTTGTLPTPLTATNEYWVTKVDSDTIRLHSSLPNSLQDVYIPLSGSGSGTISLVPAPNLKRLYWFDIGALGHDGDGFVSLGSDFQGYSDRFSHKPRAMAYAVGKKTAGSLSTPIAIEFTLPRPRSV